MKKKVLLITRYFPPLDSIATSRMYSWAKYLYKNGWDVSILTTTKSNQVVTPFKTDTSNFRVYEIDYFDPITFLGFDKKKEFQNFKDNKKIETSFWKKLIKNFYRQRMNERMPGRTDFWIWKAYKELKKQKKMGIEYDYIISSYGPPSAHIVGYYAKKIFQKPWLADYRDLWIENHLFKGLWPFTVLEKWIEKKIISNSDIITTVSDSLCKILTNKFSSIPCRVVENGFDPEIMDLNLGGYFDLNIKKVRIVYTGSLYAKRQDPSPLFRVLKKLLQEKKISNQNFEVLFFGSNINGLSELVEKFQVSDVVKYCGSVSLEDSYQIQKSADALLFLENINPKIDGILTGKLFEYLYVSTPILAIGVQEKSAPGKLIQQTNAGVICEVDVRKIEEQIIKLLKGVFSYKKNREKVLLYSRERQVKKIMDLLNIVENKKTIKDFAEHIGDCK